jgi:predicted amidohydrolase YtcJ
VAIQLLQNQLAETQCSLSSHVEKFRALGISLSLQMNMGLLQMKVKAIVPHELEVSSRRIKQISRWKRVNKKGRT